MAEKGNTAKLDYLELLKSTQKQIDEKYEEAIQIFRDRKTCLLTKISDLETEYIQLEGVRDGQLTKLEAVKSIYWDSPGDNVATDLQERVIKGIQTEIDQLEATNHAKDVKFLWNSELEEEIGKLGWIEVDGNRHFESEEKERSEAGEGPQPDGRSDDENEPTPKIDPPTACAYREIHFPKVESYSTGAEYDQLNSPGGVAICHDDTFYVADHNNNRVSAYTHWGKHTFSFQHPGFMGLVNKMQGPWGLCCYGNNIYLTESRSGSQHAALKMFTLNGTCTADVTKFGSNDGEFSDPTGLDIDEEKKELYVCDRGNNRVQIFTVQLRFLRIFIDKMIHQPRDVKIGNNFVFILDENDPCIHLFHKNTGKINLHVQLKGNMKPVTNPWFFILDKEGNILISDRDNNLIQIFSQEGQLLHILGDSEGISFENPTGLAINLSGNIVSVCMKEAGCLQIL